MRAALAQHDAVLEGAIRRHDGVWFKRVGDAMQAAFAAAPDALAAAVEAQRGLGAASWGPDGPVSVRMALHAGEAAPHRGDYVAPCLNRLARLMAAGHGGQILLSQAAALLVRDDVPPGVALHSLGTHRLRDLLAPEEVFQADVDGLPGAFPALKTLDAHPNNLPQALTPLIDRSDDLAAVNALLARNDVRLVTLTGPGGIGKSRLALQLAADALDGFPDGAFFVPLAAVHDPTLVLPALAAAVGVSEGGSAPLAATLAARLATRHMLAVLDNVEQVLAVGPALAALLEACAHLTLLVTSRAPLRVRGEHEYAVGPLGLPGADGADGANEEDESEGHDVAGADSHAGRPFDAVDDFGAAAIARSPAVMLFVDRAQAMSADFTLTPENASAVAAICRRLDGLPLAIELAAARVRLLPPAALLARLEGRLAQLGGGLRDLPARQQTLAATLDWSHALLTGAQQALFRRLAVFRGGWTLELADTVCATGVDPGVDNGVDNGAGTAAPIDVLDALAALADHSLIQPVPAGDVARFTMFHVVTEYAAEHLAAAGEADATEARHAAAMAALAEEGRRNIIGGQQLAWLERLSAEHANLRAALDRLLQRGDDAAALALSADLWRYWYLRGHLQEGRAYLSRTLTAPGAGAAGDARARASNGLGVLSWLQGDFAAARTALGEARALASSLGDDALVLRVTHNLGVVAVDEGDLDTAAALGEANLAVARRLGDAQAEAGVLHGLGVLSAERADLEVARTHFTGALALQRRLDDREGMAATMVNLAGLCVLSGDLTGAERWLDEAQPLAEAVEDVWTLGTLRQARGEVAIAQHRLDDAGRALAGAARLRLSAGDQKGLSRVLVLTARLMLAAADARTAAQLLGAAAALRERVGAPLSPREAPQHEGYVASARAALGDAAYAAAWAAGAALDPEAVADLALGAEMEG
ncbi:MAG: tetratricopeptide repeat protein [Ardenticatenales bacterium]|nr:tetratricopeptide repeat protein [Ardenticatenales bacterium]